MTKLLYKEESYKIIGICMEVYNELGKGFSEIVYSDALEIEFQDNNIEYSREKRFKIKYKGNILSHHYKADFLINNAIILEVKAVENLVSAHIKKTLNYLAASKLQLGLLVNFGGDSLNYKRIVL